MTSSSNAIVRSSGDIAESNRIHEECLAQCAAFKKAGGKVTVMLTVERATRTKGINRNLGMMPLAKDALKGLNTIEKFKLVIKKYKKLTRARMATLTGLARCTITRDARILEDAGFITRDHSGGTGSQVTFSIVASA